MRALLLISALFMVSACSDSAEVGAGEPFRVRGAQFVPGPLPGSEPAPAPTPEDPQDAANLPEISSLESPSSIAYQGASGKKLSGRVNALGVAVGLRMKDAGSGYWVVPTTTRDPQTNELIWDAVCDFDLGLKPGLTQLELVAFDDAGHPGTKTTSKLCVAARVPNALNECDPTADPPAAVISLRWDSNVDLDLQVLTPNQRWVDPKHNSTRDPKDTSSTEALGSIDRDSNGGCSIDGIRYENLVWKTPPTGRFGVYANLFDSCKRDSVRFEASVWVSRETEDGLKHLVQVGSRSGELLSSQANGGIGTGMFLFETTF